jgi:hypothetical protein
MAPDVRMSISAARVRQKCTTYSDMSRHVGLPRYPNTTNPPIRPPDLILDRNQICPSHLTQYCETGYIASSQSDGGLKHIFNRRSAAITITIDAP